MHPHASGKRGGHHGSPKESHTVSSHGPAKETGHSSGGGSRELVVGSSPGAMAMRTKPVRAHTSIEQKSGSKGKVPHTGKPYSEE